MDNLLHNILAVIHRDDGSYTDVHGVEKSCQVAHQVITKLRIDAELGKAKDASKGPDGRYVSRFPNPMPGPNEESIRRKQRRDRRDKRLKEESDEDIKRRQILMEF